MAVVHRNREWRGLEFRWRVKHGRDVVSTSELHRNKEVNQEAEHHYGSDQTPGSRNHDCTECVLPVHMEHFPARASGIGYLLRKCKSQPKSKIRRGCFSSQTCSHSLGLPKSSKARSTTRTGTEMPVQSRHFAASDHAVQVPRHQMSCLKAGHGRTSASRLLSAG